MKRALRVLLVEDHPAVRQGLRMVLEMNRIAVCREADDPASGLRGVAETRPDLALIDLSLGEENGLDLIRQLAEGYPDLILLVYSMFEDAAHVRQAMRAGASGYLAKREPISLLPQAIDRCLAGEIYLSPRITEKLTEAKVREALSTTFSRREQEVYDLLGQDCGSSVIASRLGLGRRTVETYYQRILAKLDLPGMAELRRRARAD
jgi:DNA-binding NarL/FixJ family response regulator